MGTKETQLTERIVAQAEHLAEHKDKPTKRRRIKRKRYTDQDKAAALAHLQSKGGVIPETARELSIPVNTLKGWATGRGLGPAVAEQYAVLKETLSAKLADLANQLIDAMPEKIEAASLRDVGATLANVIDKMRLLQEQPTAITETIDRRAMLERLIERTLHEFPDMTREEVIELIGEVRPEAMKLLS